MSKKIRMGDDEFILYVRKNGFGKKLTNPTLGKKIWEYIQKLDPTAKIVERDQPCRWGDTGSCNELNLPKTATQFEFSEHLLPNIYGFLQEL